MSAPRTASEIAAVIDHALLAPALTDDQLRAGLDEAATLGVLAVCVRPCDVAVAATHLGGSGPRVGTVIGFPHGTHTTRAVCAEAEGALAEGANELDMVINVGWVRSGRLADVERQVAVVCELAHPHAEVKVICEAAYLTPTEIALACGLAEAAGADYVKTSTGYAPHGARVEDVALMRASVSPHVGVKASGGIANLADLERMLDAGATRIGTSRSAQILAAARAREGA